MSFFLCSLSVLADEPSTLNVERVTTIAPFPRGLALIADKMYVLCRGRVRGAGGVSAEIEDQAGTIYIVDPVVSEPLSSQNVSDAVRNNGKVFALPTKPPFILWDRSMYPPERDRFTDRPYCTLRYHEATRSLYICAFSGIDKPKKPGEISFSKNLTDAILRYDLRTLRWYEVERHNIEGGGNYPHHDPLHSPQPHGWLNGPDNCLPLGHGLYVVSKDNNLLARYDLSAIVEDPEAGPPPSKVILNENIDVKGHGVQPYFGHSALAYHDGWLYMGYRTSSVIVRLQLDKAFIPIEPIQAELLARFDPYNSKTGKSANITDIEFDPKGRLYVVSARPSRIYRFTPNPDAVFDGRTGHSKPWADMAVLTGSQKMKSENLLFYNGHIYVTSGDGYGFQNGALGTVYRVRVND